MYVFYVSGKFLEAHFFVFYVSERLLEARLYVFDVSGKRPEHHLYVFYGSGSNFCRIFGQRVRIFDAFSHERCAFLPPRHPAG